MFSGELKCFTSTFLKLEFIGFFLLQNHICLNLFSNQVADGNNTGAIKLFQCVSLSICQSVCPLSLKAFELISSAFNTELGTLKFGRVNE